MSSIHSLQVFDSEIDLFNCLIDKIKIEDPDILVGFETDNKSWGCLSKRFNVLFKGDIKDADFSSQISRSKNNRDSKRLDPWIAAASSHFYVYGRIVFNLWRIFRDEITLRSYTISALHMEFFGVMIPEYSNKSLLDMIEKNPKFFVDHIVTSLEGVFNLTTKTPFLVKAIEFSRLFGIDIFSTLTRGSQYRVEAILTNAAHSENYLLRTPCEAEVRSMRAAQGLPLTLEPISGYYTDPIVVLDFQSLYPSLIIAHNLCYSTVIGSVNEIKNEDELISCGIIHNPVPAMYNAASFEELTSISSFKAPGGILFAKKDKKSGLLPRLLQEILRTRILIKNAMKSCDVVSYCFTYNSYI